MAATTFANSNGVRNGLKNILSLTNSQLKKIGANYESHFYLTLITIYFI